MFIFELLYLENWFSELDEIYAVARSSTCGCACKISPTQQGSTSLHCMQEGNTGQGRNHWWKPCSVGLFYFHVWSAVSFELIVEARWNSRRNMWQHMCSCQQNFIGSGPLIPEIYRISPLPVLYVHGVFHQSVSDPAKDLFSSGT